MAQMEQYLIVTLVIVRKGKIGGCNLLLTSPVGASEIAQTLFNTTHPSQSRFSLFYNAFFLINRSNDATKVNFNHYYFVERQNTNATKANRLDLLLGCRICLFHFG